MDPQKWLCADAELEQRLQDCIDWYELCQDAIRKEPTSEIVRQLKCIFLSSVNLNDITDYLAFYRPHMLSVSTLNKIEEEAWGYQRYATICSAQSELNRSPDKNEFSRV